MKKRHPIYATWASMNQRCHCSTHKAYSSYGARGIAVTPEWRGKGGFQRFLDYIGPRPSPRHSIDRIDNDRGYEPGNVRWATKTEQVLNRRITLKVTIGGETLPVSTWCDRFGLPYKSVHQRVRLLGWDIVRALQTPLRISRLRGVPVFTEDTLKSCTGCQEAKPLRDFYLDKRATDGRTPKCRKCTREYQRRFRNPEQSRVRTARYRTKKKHLASLTPDEFAMVHRVGRAS